MSFHCAERKVLDKDGGWQIIAQQRIIPFLTLFTSGQRLIESPQSDRVI